jgi:hypothetical protein
MRLGGKMSHWVDFVTHYKDEIVAVGTFFLAVFAGGSIYIAWQQNKLTRTLERAYLVIKPLGIRPLKSDAGQLVGYIAIENVGHLPAKNVRWFISIKPANGSNENQFPIGKHAGDNFLPRGVEMIEGSESISSRDILSALPTNLYFYVWGEIKYNDGFAPDRWMKFCHRYSWHSFSDVGGEVCMSRPERLVITNTGDSG